MSIDLESQTSAATVEFAPPARMTIEARNLELLQHRDAALLLAYRFAGSRADAEDILQEAYLKAVRAREPLLTGDPLRRWFFQIAANTAVNALRSEQRRRARERSAAAMHETVVPERSGPEAAELKQDLEKELAALEEKYRTAISLHYEQGFSYEEAAEILETPAGTLRSYASQGIKVLRARLERPSRGLTAEALIALLAAGVVLKPSAAFAAAVETLVAAPPLLSGAASTGATSTSATTSAPVASSMVQATTVGGAKIFATASSTGIGFAWKVAGAFAVLVMTFVLGAASGILFDRNFMRNENEAPVVNNNLIKPDAPPLANAAGIPSVAPVQDPAPIKNDPVEVTKPVLVAPRQFPNAFGEKLAGNEVGGASVQDYVPPAEVEAEWANAVDLMQNIRPQRDGYVGEWTLIDGKLSMSPAKFGRLAIPCSAPEEYDFRIDFTRQAGLGPHMIFSVNGKSASWLMGAADGNRYCFGQHQNNPQAVLRPAFANGVRHTCIVQVRKNSLTAYLDGNLVQGIMLNNNAPYETTSDYRLPDSAWFGLGGWLASVQFHRIAVRELKGKVTPADPKTFEVDSSVAYWTGAKNLSQPVIDASTVLGGDWRVQGGKLSMFAREDHARIRFNFEPPEEYDMLVDFSRTQGKRGMLQILSAKGRQFMMRVDEDGMSGMDEIGGQHFYSSPLVMHTTPLENHTKHRSIVCVRKDSIRLFVDGKLWLRWAPADFEAVELEQLWSLKSPKSIGLATFKSNYSFEWILVKELSGPGKDLPADNNSLPAGAPDQAAQPPRPKNAAEAF